ncbi:class I SAM-dependent methyltransferase [Spirosoma aerophilum]
MSQAKQTAEKVDYNGADNLAMMSHAINYNGGLFKWVSRDIRPGEAILDFGAGNGEYANRFPIGSVDAAEIDPELLPLIKQPVYTDITTLAKTYDLIYTINVLEHIEHHGEIVKELYKKLKPGGRIKVFVPARQEIFSNMDEHVGHYRRYDKKMVRQILEAAGLRVTDCRYYDFVGYFISLIYKWLGKDGRITKESVIFYDRIIFPVSRLFDTLTGGQVIGKNVIAEAVKPK